MRIKFHVTDDSGRQFKGEAVLAPTTGAPARGAGPSRGQKARPKSGDRLDAVSNLQLPLRAFVKKCCKGKTGPQKFTLLVAKLTDRKTPAEVAVRAIEKSWNRMTQHMGGRFNAAYSTRARDNGWVDSPKQGVYALLPAWTEILAE